MRELWWLCWAAGVIIGHAAGLPFLSLQDNPSATNSTITIDASLYAGLVVDNCSFTAATVNVLFMDSSSTGNSVVVNITRNRFPGTLWVKSGGAGMNVVNKLLIRSVQVPTIVLDTFAVVNGRLDVIDNTVVSMAFMSLFVNQSSVTIEGTRMSTVSWVSRIALDHLTVIASILQIQNNTMVAPFSGTKYTPAPVCGDTGVISHGFVISSSSFSRSILCISNNTITPFVAGNVQCFSSRVPYALTELPYAFGVGVFLVSTVSFENASSVTVAFNVISMASTALAAVNVASSFVRNSTLWYNASVIPSAPTAVVLTPPNRTAISDCMGCEDVGPMLLGITRVLDACLTPVEARPRTPSATRVRTHSHTRRRTQTRTKWLVRHRMATNTNHTRRAHTKTQAFHGAPSRTLTKALHHRDVTRTPQLSRITKTHQPHENSTLAPVHSMVPSAPTSSPRSVDTPTVIVNLGYGGAAVAGALSPTAANKAAITSRVITTYQCSAGGGQSWSFPSPDQWTIMPAVVSNINETASRIVTTIATCLFIFAINIAFSQLGIIDNRHEDKLLKPRLAF